MKLNLPTVGPILGYTTSSQCRIWFRGEYESLGNTSYRRCFGVLRYRKQGEAKWSAPLINKMSPNFDVTCVLSPSGLMPRTGYEYQVGWLHLEAELENMAGIGEELFEWPDKHHFFYSGTDNLNEKRSYVVGSCRYLLKTCVGDVFDDRGDKIFKSISDQHAFNPIAGLLMIGDQIYADDLNFISQDTKLPEFLSRYRTVFSQENIRNLMSTVPTYMILDDHEIEDNWPSKSCNQDKVVLYPNAIHAYQIYQCSHSPLFDAKLDGRIEGILQKFWYSFTDGCADWFVMDSRTERFISKSRRNMVNQMQLDALFKWLEEGDNRVKMIVTSVPFAPDLDNDASDKWGAFPEQRTQILEFLAKMRSSKVVFVSGDVHCSFTAKIFMQGRDAPLAYQIVSSSFFWPYPHMHKGEFIQNQPLITTTPDSPFFADITSDVYSEDNFARLDISKEEIIVSFFERKGSALGPPYHLKF